MVQATQTGGVRIAIDRGGTFTDVHCSRDGHPDFILKLLSVDPANYADAPTEGIRRALGMCGISVEKGEKIDLKDIESIRMGTTVATNALLERQGERCALVTTKGFRDLLRIGKQARPDIFDLTVTKLSYLYEEAIEIDERVTIETFLLDPNPPPVPKDDPQLVRGTTGELLRVLKKPDMNEVKAQLEGLWDKGYRSLAVALVHSWTFPEHEAAVADAAREMGFSVSVSHQLQPTIKILSRANSATADAYLSPITRRYIQSFAQGFVGGTSALEGKLLFMQSDGGLCRWDRFSGLRAVLSGPAGGVIGYSKICYDPEDGTALVAVDMGGTSTDVSRYAGSLEHISETTTAQVILTATSLDVNTVAAGGGSRLFWKNNMFVVGPESAGAHPGPVSYGKGGPLAVTDANLLLGRLLPEQFPRIFGPNEDQPLDLAATRTAFQSLASTINSENAGAELTIEEIASGFLDVANEAMCRPIRTLTEARGFDTSAHNLVIFGGAGGQHGTAIASSLGIRRIIVPTFSSILSAYGMSVADIVEEVQEPSACTTAPSELPQVFHRAQVLREEAVQRLYKQGFPDERIEVETFFNCRYQGSSTALMVPAPKEGGDLDEAFTAQHRTLFGFTLADRKVFIDDIRIRATGVSQSKIPGSLYHELESVSLNKVRSGQSKEVYYAGLGWLPTQLVALKFLDVGDYIEGPALLYDETQTILVEPQFIATSLTHHVVLDRIGEKPTTALSLEHWDPVQLSVFGHRFMSIAEQMGSILRQTAISVNIKERLDFSCALFDPEGNLTANAPDMPAHLGAMSSAVRYQANLWKGKLQDGDVFVSNAPSAGGSHLPDITVMTPAFHEGEIVFWTASRAHHADIGGIRAGSMPPFSTEIWQEGANIESFKLVKAGVFDEPGITKLLFDDPATYPGCSGTRTLSDNISDLKAQISANHRGITLIKALCEQFGTSTVQHYMLGIQNAAEVAVRDLLTRVGAKFGDVPLEAEDYLDDGSTIRLKITIDASTGSAVFDFTGTSKQVYGNLNAPTAILYSAILYALRCLINIDMPLNHGCLLPIELIVPPGCLLAPSEDAATVAGNVETSQRMTDTIFKCFKACGASQGGCNNFTFGYGETGPDGKFGGFGFYETIGGGSGAGATWDGQSGTHVHMSNTSIGDVEISERNYPMVIREYSIREGSGGAGRRPGGNGCIRAVEFTRDVDFAILSERRTIAPYGMLGGEPGAKGENSWIRHKDGKKAIINLGGKNQCRVMAGDVIIIKTPGGGGFGKPGSTDDGEAMEYITTTQKGPPKRGMGSVSQFRETQFTA